MLVTIFKDRPDAAPESTRLHFETAPAVGETIELDGRMYVVNRAWHRPDEGCVGSKFAVLLGLHGEAEAA
jgi:hypothetical protein